MFKIVFYLASIIAFAQDLNDLINDETAQNPQTSREVTPENIDILSNSNQNDPKTDALPQELEETSKSPIAQEKTISDPKMQDPTPPQSKPQNLSETKTEENTKDLKPQNPKPSNEVPNNPTDPNKSSKTKEALRAVSPQELKQKITNCEEKNDKKTCFEVGMLYYQGLSAYGQKLKEALYFFDRSCDAQQGLGCYQAGIISAKDEHYQHAFIFLEKACQSGDLRGCKNLGILYYNGWGTTKNIYKATELFRTSCKQGDKASCQKLYLALGNAYKEALNYTGAKKNYQTACNLGEAEACENIKVIEMLEKQKHYENAIQNNVLKKRNF